MQKQLIHFFGIFLFLAIGMHFSEWMSHPVEHLMALPSSGAYGLGMAHPLIFTVIAYLVVMLLIFLVKKIKNLF
ncbi:MAG TPA: hypothetical protein EYM49_07420 [Campylobacterales bacterium]|nr:hypothetical protein [Campylobacterales bacterium]